MTGKETGPSGTSESVTESEYRNICTSYIDACNLQIDINKALKGDHEKRIEEAKRYADQGNVSSTIDLQEEVGSVAVLDELINTFTVYKKKLENLKRRKFSDKNCAELAAIIQPLEELLNSLEGVGDPYGNDEE